MSKPYHECQGCDTLECLATCTRTQIGDESTVLTWWLHHMMTPCECGRRFVVQNYEQCGVKRTRLYCRCNRTRSPKAGTGLEGSRLSLFQLFYTFYSFANGDSLKSIRQELKVDDETCSRVVKVLVTLIAVHNFIEFIDSDEMTYLECDETAIGQRKYHRGARRRKSGVIWVAGIVSVGKEGVDRMIGHVVHKRDKASLQPLISHVASSDATIVTDCWKGYIGVARDEEQVHKTVNHKKEFVTNEGFHTNHVESMWRRMKNEIRSRWTNLGERNLEACNGRVQTGIFFAVLSKIERNPFVALMTLLKASKELLQLHKEVQDLQAADEAKALEAKKAEAAESLAERAKRLVQHPNILEEANIFYQQAPKADDADATPKLKRPTPPPSVSLQMPPNSPVTPLFPPIDNEHPPATPQPEEPHPDDHQEHLPRYKRRRLEVVPSHLKGTETKISCFWCGDKPPGEILRSTTAPKEPVHAAGCRIRIVLPMARVARVQWLDHPGECASTIHWNHVLPTLPPGLAPARL